MPLILITGTPCSGKTTAAMKIKEFLEKEKGKTVFIIQELQKELSSSPKLSESDIKNSIYSDSLKEKGMRGFLKSEILRSLNKNTVVLFDGSNYIKGFRYELYCASKAAKTTQVTVHCDLSRSDAWNRNQNRPESERYSRETFDGLYDRYEAPKDSNRWDSPLYLVLKDGVVRTEDIFEGLFSRKAPPPNQSTQCQPLSSTDFLYQFDKVTTDINKSILESLRRGMMPGDEISVPESSVRILLSKTVTLPELTRAKRQFINYAKNRALDNVSILASMYVQYLNKNVFI